MDMHQTHCDCSFSTSGHLGLLPLATAKDECWLSLSHPLYIKPTQEAESAERIELHFATMGKKNPAAYIVTHFGSSLLVWKLFCIQLAISSKPSTLFKASL